MWVLGIESSCDETAAAVVERRDASPDVALVIRSNVIHSQARTHARWGGVVPEVASREHIEQIVTVVDDAVRPLGGLEAISGIAVTQGPGLVGSLLVGLQFAKGLAMARDLPWIGVNHLEGHLAAQHLADPPPRYPHVALVVSGGHSHLYRADRFGEYARLGRTLDDAAGEAFDKVAKVLGLGYPGGVAIENTGRGGDPAAYALPRALPDRKVFDFSFSGLKTAVLEHVRAGVPEGDARRDLCASVQEAICDALTRKAVHAAQREGVTGVVMAGGVAANTRLRELLAERCAAVGLWSFAPPKALCTDNGAMIAAAGLLRLARGERGTWTDPPRARWPLGVGPS